MAMAGQAAKKAQLRTFGRLPAGPTRRYAIQRAKTLKLPADFSIDLYIYPQMPI